MPSRRPPIVTVWTWARPWVIASRFSYRLSFQRAGRPSTPATQPTAACSGSAPNLAPNAPPTSGVITRTRSRSTPSNRASVALLPWAPWLGIQAVSRPSSPQTAAAARPSIGAGATRWLRIVRVTTTSQSSNRCSSSSAPYVVTVLVPAAGNSRVSSPAASCGSTTAGSGS